MNITSPLDRFPTTAEPEYDMAFWKMVKGNGNAKAVLAMGDCPRAGGHYLPSHAHTAFYDKRNEESIFRGIATVQYANNNGNKINAVDHDDAFSWAEEFDEIPEIDVDDDFTEYPVNSYKLASILKISVDFANDHSFDLERYLVRRMAKSCSKAEDNAFVNGNGENQPTGILHATSGAETGITATEITFDNIISLYFSVKPEYRKNAVWMMNDNTAMTLRMLKDENGNYLWNHSNDTIFGKKVIINNYMPDADDGEKPIAFGDFSYYWIVDRKPLSIRVLEEKYLLTEYLGYMAVEFLDAKLIRPEAIKVLKIEEE